MHAAGVDRQRARSPTCVVMCGHPGHDDAVGRLPAVLGLDVSTPTASVTMWRMTSEPRPSRTSMTPQIVSGAPSVPARCSGRIPTATCRPS